MKLHPPFHYIQIELFVVVLTLLAAHIGPWRRGTAAVERWLGSLAVRPRLAMMVVAALSLVLRLGLLGVEPMPHPLFHDEFSYLLGADTFVHGRVTNPQPPVPLAFETIHTNMWPTYGSMYLPGTGLVLAGGELLGQPWIAVLLVTALFCAAVYWIALTGSMGWWFDNYFLIVLPALGAALVLGSLPRIMLRQSPGAAAMLGIGLVLLVLTRPYEGFVVAFPCTLVLLWTLRATGARKLLTLSAPPLAMLGATMAWLFYVNWRGTGHPFLFPYMLNYRQYHITGAFLFSHNRPLPAYHNRMLAKFYPGAELPQYEFATHHPLEFLLRKVLVYYRTFLFGYGLLMAVGVAFVAARWRQGIWLAPALAFACICAQVALMAWAPFPQYAAPASAVFLLLIASASAGYASCASAGSTGSRSSADWRWPSFWWRPTS